jgi:hypothetical protein
MPSTSSRTAKLRVINVRDDPSDGRANRSGASANDAPIASRATAKTPTTCLEFTRMANRT